MCFLIKIKISCLYQPYIHTYTKTISIIYFNRLHALDAQVISKTTHKETDGLATFLSFVDSDELLSTTEMVFLQTLVISSAMVSVPANIALSRQILSQ